MVSRSAWEVRLAAAAEHDFHEIVRWTNQQFGEAQARVYAKTLECAISALMAGPDVLGARKRDDIQAGLRALHVAMQGRKGRHFLIFRVATLRNRSVIDVLRVLHDSMDLPRHLPDTA